MIKEYKWLSVVINKKQWKVNASYNRFSKVIVLYPSFFKLSIVRQYSILEHEYSHHIYWRMPILYRKLWEFISNWKLIKVLNIMWITKYKKNAFVSEYAKTKSTEDFAECIEIKYLSDNDKKKTFKTYADFKMKIAYSMYTYFSNQ